MSNWLDLSNNANTIKSTYIQGFLDVSGSIQTRNSSDQLIIAGDANFNQRLFVNGDVSFNNNLSVNGDVSLNRNVYIGGDISWNPTNVPNASIPGSALQSIQGSVTGHLVPNLNEVYDLGSSTKRFRDLYLSGNTINIGDAQISATTENGINLPASSQIDGAPIGGLLFSGAVDTVNDLTALTGVKGGETYIANDSRIGYIAKQDNPTSINDHWTSIGEVRGPQGLIGTKGEKGVNGDKGVKGIKGDSGGQTGPKGSVGPAGDTTGATGQRGERGHTGPIGPTGLKGEKGIIGATGPTGSKGERGHTGPTGPIGSTGSKGERGPTGPIGTTGQKGVNGSTGPTGSIGPTGQKGQKGEIGPTGQKGQKGEIGPTGPTGQKGEIGENGPTGPNGFVDANSNINFQGELQVTQDVSFNKDLQILGTLTISGFEDDGVTKNPNGALIVKGDASFNNNVSANNVIANSITTSSLAINGLNISNQITTADISFNDGSFNNLHIKKDLTVGTSLNEHFVVEFTSPVFHYRINGVDDPTLNLVRGCTYTFDLTHTNLQTNPFIIKSSGSQYTDGITYTGSQGNSGASLTFIVPFDGPNTLDYENTYSSQNVPAGSINIIDPPITAIQINTDLSLNSRLFVLGDVSLNSNLYVKDNLTVDGNVSLRKYNNEYIVNTNTTNYDTIITDDLSIQGNLYVSQDISLNERLFVGGDVSINNRLFIGGDISWNPTKIPNNSIPVSAMIDGGSTGPTGPQGSKGEKGIIGATGPTGVIGPTGPTGFVGPTGAQGIKGEKGEIGSKGPKGEKGVFGGSTTLNYNDHIFGDISLSGSMYVNGDIIYWNTSALNENTIPLTAVVGGENLQGTPIGTIALWSGSISNIPNGWSLCNGNGTYTDTNNNTQNIPDLRGKFVIGYDNRDPSFNIDMSGASFLVDPTTEHGAGRERSTFMIGDISDNGSWIDTTNNTQNGNDSYNENIYYSLAYIIKVSNSVFNSFTSGAKFNGPVIFEGDISWNPANLPNQSITVNSINGSIFSKDVVFYENVYFSKEVSTNSRLFVNSINVSNDSSFNTLTVNNFTIKNDLSLNNNINIGSNNLDLHSTDSDSNNNWENQKNLFKANVNQFDGNLIVKSSNIDTQPSFLPKVFINKSYTYTQDINHNSTETVLDVSGNVEISGQLSCGNATIGGYKSIRPINEDIGTSNTNSKIVTFNFGKIYSDTSKLNFVANPIWQTNNAQTMRANVFNYNTTDGYVIVSSSSSWDFDVKCTIVIYELH